MRTRFETAYEGILKWDLLDAFVLGMQPLEDKVCVLRGSVCVRALWLRDVRDVNHCHSQPSKLTHTHSYCKK